MVCDTGIGIPFAALIRWFHQKQTVRFDRRTDA